MIQIGVIRREAGLFSLEWVHATEEQTGRIIPHGEAPGHAAELLNFMNAGKLSLARRK
jgi:hypothetical protein